MQIERGFLSQQEFTSLDELASLISAATDGWDTRWYRGTPSPSYALLPKIFRDKSVQKREGYISVEFRRRARLRMALSGSQFDWLCALQHYGLPTRLLDWTESLAVALYFTIRLWGTPIIAPTIWVLDPFRLYQLSIPGHEIIPTANHFTAIANADIAFSDNSEETAKDVTDLAIPVLPDFIFDRLAAQNGCFTIHGRSERLLEDMLTSSVTRILHKFVARRDKLSNIFESLDVYIPSPDALFPDLEGIKDYII